MLALGPAFEHPDWARGTSLSSIAAVLFHKASDVTSAFVKGYSNPPDDIRQAWIERSFASMIDTLLVAPELAVKVTGPNFPLAMMAQCFGYEATTELLRTGAVKFILWTGTIMHDEQQPGSPLAAMDLINDAFTYPAVSAQVALEAWCPALSRTETSKLSQLAQSVTVKIPPNIAFQVMTHIETMRLRGEIQLGDLSRDEQRQLAQDLLEAAVIVSEGWDWGEYTSSWSLMMRACELVLAHDRFLEVTEEVFDVAGIPTPSSIFLDGRAAASDIVELRKKRETIDLRDWLWGNFRNQVAQGDRIPIRELDR